jgi:hypothetical protein
VRLEGRISSLSLACPVRTFVVDGQQVMTSPSTHYRDMDCEDLRNGREVKVRGVRQLGGVILATRIDDDDDDDDDD